MADRTRFYEAEASGARRSAPAVMRNREPIAEVLKDWLPSSGLVFEIASGSGEHIVYFAERFPALDWQPSDIHPDALSSIAAWREDARLPNLRSPVLLDAAAPHWNPMSEFGNAGARLERLPARDIADEMGSFDALLCINMVHISPWSAALGLLDGAARVLKRSGALILYGPWLEVGVDTAPSNLAFDQQLRERDPEWGLRHVEDFDAAASERGFTLEQTRAMPANNLMLLFRLGG